MTKQVRAHQRKNKPVRRYVRREAQAMEKWGDRRYRGTKAWAKRNL